MKKINQYKLLAGIYALALLASCDYEEINTNWAEMNEKEEAMDGVAVGGLVTTMEQTVFPVGTQADDTDIINMYQTDYHLSADCWSGFFSQNNSWNGGNNNTSYYLIDGWIKGTYARSYTNALDPWKKLKAASERTTLPKFLPWHKY